MTMPKIQLPAKTRPNSFQQLYAGRAGRIVAGLTATGFILPETHVPPDESH
jgi:hypothetical protein